MSIENQENQNFVEQIQQNNLALVERMREFINPEAPSDAYVIDIFDKETVGALKDQVHFDLKQNTEGETGERRQRIEWLNEITQGYGEQIEFLSEPELVVATQRTNLKEFPIPWQAYHNNPYFYKFKTPDVNELEYPGLGYLDNGVGVHINTPALVLARTSATFKDSDGNDQSEEFLYVATNTVRGWVVAKDFVKTTQANAFDPLRPHDNLAKVAERGTNLGIVTTYGLKLDGDRLVKVDKFKGNAKFSGDPTANESYESMGDGILETGETALMSIGNTIEVVREEESDFIVRLPNLREFRVNKEFIHIGYIPPTEENMNKLLAETIDAPYSWGDKGGMGFDCSGFTLALIGSAGIIMARGGAGQRFGLEGKEFLAAERATEDEDFINYMPQSLTDLSMRKIDPNKIKWGYTTLSWGTHVVIMSGVDNNGDIIYTHSVGPRKKILKENINNPTAEKRVSTKSMYRVVTAKAQEYDDEGNLLTYSPYLTDPRWSYIQIVVHV